GQEREDVAFEPLAELGVVRRRRRRLRRRGRRLGPSGHGHGGSIPDAHDSDLRRRLLSYLEGGWEDGRVADDDKTPKRNRWTPEGGSGGSGVPRPRFSPWLALPLLLIIVLIFN